MDSISIELVHATLERLPSLSMALWLGIGCQENGIVPPEEGTDHRQAIQLAGFLKEMRIAVRLWPPRTSD